MEELGPGTVVAGRFTVSGAALGWGASGVVYPAVDSDGDEVAVKLLHPHVAHDPEAFGRLEREVSRARTLRHRHVLGVLGLFPHGARTALVTQRVAGPTVARLDHALPVEAALAVGIGLCDGLAAAHGVGLVHGDVRPGNVLLGEGGAVLFDFGIAGVAPSALRPGETPPEVADGAPPGERADLYGVGLVVARALLGRDVFDHPTPWARLGAQRVGRPRLPVGRDRIPVGVESLLRQLLHPDPARRPGSASAVRRVMARLLRRPHRAVRVRAPLAGVAPFRGWVVHGVDPSTGAAALVRARLSGREARRLARRLDAEGWQARPERVALGLQDLAWVAFGFALGFVLLPVLGAPFGALAMLRWRSGRLRPELPEVLPAVAAPLPPRRLGSSEGLVVAGLLLAVGGPVAWLSGWLALLPLVAAVALIAHDLRPRLDPARLARSARIRAAFAHARGSIERAGLPLDRHLGASGTLDALEGRWLDGEVGDDDVLLALEGVAPEAPAPRDAARGPHSG